MNILRQYKLHNLGIKTLIDFPRLMDYVYSKISNLSKLELESYPTSVFFMDSNNKYIFSFDKSNSCLYLRYRNFCEKIRNDFNLSDDDAMSFVQMVIEESADKKFEKNKYSHFIVINYAEEIYEDRIRLSYFMNGGLIEEVEKEYKTQK